MPVNYTKEICILLTYIERHVQEEISSAKLELILNFSRRHIRQIFRVASGIPLARYIKSRKIAHAAMEIMLSKKSLTEIAFAYGFESYDTFTRAFRREIGVNPSLYRNSGIVSGRRLLCEGVYGPFVLSSRTGFGSLLMFKEDSMNQIQEKDSCILFGVPKVFYGRQYDGGMQGTSFPMCLQAVLSYMGQKISYCEIMAATGTAFRLRWNSQDWNDFSAVDIRNIYQQHNRSFELGFRLAGRSHRILEREACTKEEMSQFIRSEIDEGRPLIALGVVGPPEASIITGYSEGGETLHGWSLFQDSPEWTGGSVSVDESGYFICRDWWGENTDAVMSIGEQRERELPIREILENALFLLKEETIHAYEGRCALYLGGQAAYDAWAKNFDRGALTPMTPEHREQLENERIYTGDAAGNMIWEGRGYAAEFFYRLSKEYPDFAEPLKKCAKYFYEASQNAHEILEQLNYHGPDSLQRMEDPAVRRQVAALIRSAGDYELKARNQLESILEIWK